MEETGRGDPVGSQGEHGDLPGAPFVRDAPKALFQPWGTCGAGLTLPPDRNRATSAPGAAAPPGKDSGLGAHAGGLTLESRPRGPVSRNAACPSSSRLVPRV